MPSGSTSMSGLGNGKSPRHSLGRTHAFVQGLKELSNWPTYPQLYVDGELVGGCDIIEELYDTQELASTCGVA